MDDKVEREQILAFRLAAHHLADRALPGDLLSVAGACGVQNSPPGSAALALNARIEGLALQHLEKCLGADRTLVELWCMRGAPYLVPVADAAVFTTGLMPDDESSCRFFIQGATNHLIKFGMQATEAVACTAQCLPQVLGGRELTKDQLGIELARCVEKSLPASLRGLWRQPDGMGQNTYGESLVRYALYAVALQGKFCLLPKTGRDAVTFMLTDQWLGRELPVMDPCEARAGLVRRFLHCYGPDTPQAFARWAGVAGAFAQASFAMVEGELSAVSYEGRTLFILQRDRPKLMNPAMPRGVRLLPPGDPYLALQQKDLLVSNAALRKKIWRSSGNPGVVLVDGEVAATWNPQKQVERLVLRVEPLLSPLEVAVRQEIEAEAGRMAPFRRVRSVRVVM